VPTPPLPATHEKWSLFLDFDGTLADIAPSPDAVTLDTRVVPALRELSRLTGGRVALISGRPIAELDAFLLPLRLPAAGLHGLERRAADGTLMSARTDPGPLQKLRESLAPILAADTNLMAEDKGLSIALHYRGAPAREEELRALMSALIERAPGYRLVRGKCVLEAVPQGSDKGSAIESFMNESPFRLGKPVFAGDDVTDEDGFAAVARMKGVAIKVGPGPTAAGFRAPSVGAVITWLESLISELPGVHTVPHSTLPAKPNSNKDHP
jgi:trehalose 6-phosphate phosphatase